MRLKVFDFQDSNKKMSYQFVVIIVNWNGGEKILNCLKSFCNIENGVKYKIIIVDNCSTDNSVEKIETDFPSVKIIKNSSNTGFSIANNIGLKYIFDNEIKTDYIFFLNNDTELLNGSIVNLLKYLDENKNVVALTPAIIESNGKFQTGVGGKYFNTINIIIYFLFLNKIIFMRSMGINLDQKYFFRRTKVVNLDWICGAAFFVRSNIISGVDFFPENYFMYFEDVVVSEKLKHKGKLVYFPEYLVKHHRDYNISGIERYFTSFYKYLSQKGFSKKKLTKNFY